MNVSQFKTGILMILKMLLRRRIVLILLVVIPLVFLFIVKLTTSDRLLPFRLASLDKEVFIEISERGISYIFFAVSSAGFLISFLALDLIQKNREANRRLIICGNHPLQLLLSILSTLLITLLAIAVYIGLLTHTFYSINNLGPFIFGLVLIGFVYGCYGLAVGSIIKNELEGILLIVLLVNIDAGWLQNPLFYAEAQNQKLIQLLPAFFPSQTSIIGAFTNYSPVNAIIGSLIYGCSFLLLSLIIFFNKTRIKKWKKSPKTAAKSYMV